MLYFDINFIYFLLFYYFTLYKLASVRLTLNEHVCVY